MAKRLEQLAIDHEYAPGAEPTFRDRLIEWFMNDAIMDLFNAACVALLMLSVYCFLRFVRSVRRVMKIREDVERMKAREAAKDDFQKAVRAAREARESRAAQGV
ncbi:MAG: hypothetical protein AAF074_15590 [Pseudomonadota bacterium]